MAEKLAREQGGVIAASKVKGTDVYNTSGDHLGSISDIVIEKVSGDAKYAVMSFGGFLGIGEDEHPIPWDKLTYNVEKDGYVVDIPKDVQFATGTYQGPTPNPAAAHKSYRPQLKGDASSIRMAAELMANAKKPVLYTGGGVINSGPQACQLLRVLNTTLTTTTKNAVFIQHRANAIQQRLQTTHIVPTGT